MKTENMTERQQANMQRVFDMPFSDLYPLYVTKVVKKNRSEAELREVISWLTGFSKNELAPESKPKTRHCSATNAALV